MKFTSRKQERRAEKQAAWAEEQRLAEIQRAALERRTLWEKIDDIRDFDDVRQVLHEFRSRMNWED